MPTAATVGRLAGSIFAATEAARDSVDDELAWLHAELVPYLHSYDYAAYENGGAIFRSPDAATYTTKLGEEIFAGIMDASGFLPDGVPAQWSVYFGVDDSDAALAKIVDLGGSIVTPAEDTPYGRLATAADATGAIFRLVAGG